MFTAPSALFLALTGGLLLTGCSGETEAIVEEAVVEVKPDPAPAKPDPVKRPERTAETDALLEKLDPEKATATAPETFQLVLTTTKGDIVVDIKRADAPNGADRLYNLVTMGFYEEVAFFRVIDGFMAQAGMHPEPAVNELWRTASIPDDERMLSNERGTLTFATRGPNTRTTQLFINFKDNSNLDGMGFSPLGRVTDEGMVVVDALYSGYGEGQPRGRGPAQQLIALEGNSYLKSKFPELDYIKSASIR